MLAPIKIYFIKTADFSVLSSFEVVGCFRLFFCLFVFCVFGLFVCCFFSCFFGLVLFVFVLFFDLFFLFSSLLVCFC